MTRQSCGKPQEAYRPRCNLSKHNLSWGRGYPIPLTRLLEVCTGKFHPDRGCTSRGLPRDVQYTGGVDLSCTHPLQVCIMVLSSINEWLIVGNFHDNFSKSNFLLCYFNRIFLQIYQDLVYPKEASHTNLIGKFQWHCANRGPSYKKVVEVSMETSPKKLYTPRRICNEAAYPALHIKLSLKYS